MRTTTYLRTMLLPKATAVLAAVVLTAMSSAPIALAQSPQGNVQPSSSSVKCTAPSKVTRTVTVDFDARTNAVSVDPMVVDVPFCTIATITWVPIDPGAYEVSDVQGCAGWGFSQGSAPIGEIRLVDPNTSQERRKDWYYRATVTDKKGHQHSSQRCNAEDPPVIHNG